MESDDEDAPIKNSKEEFTMSAFEDIMALLDIDSNDDSSIGINLDSDTDSDEDEDISETQKDTVKLRRSPRIALQENNDNSNKKQKQSGGVNCITFLPIQSIIFAGSDAIMPFITSFISQKYPNYYLQFLEDQLQLSSLLSQSYAANIVQHSISAFPPEYTPAQSTQTQSIDYFDFLKTLTHNFNVREKEAIENAYALLSSSFNNYVYEYLESLTDDINNPCNTIMDAFQQLPKEVKLLIFITNLLHDQNEDDPLDKSIYFYGGIYGNDKDVFNNLMHLAEDVTSSGTLSNIANTIFYIYEINNFHNVYCAVIQFFGIIKKYYINRNNNNEEVLITDYVKVSKESDSLINSIMNTYQNQELARLDFLIGNFLVAPLNSLQYNRAPNVQSPPIPRPPPNYQPPPNPRKRKPPSGGKRTRRIRKPKKRPTHTKRKKHNKKRGSKKLKKRNQKKRTTRRKK